MGGGTNGRQRAARELAARHRIDDGAGFVLANVDPVGAGTFGEDGKKDAESAQDDWVEDIARLQEQLYAQDRWALLLVFQAMDAAGKDGAIKHALSGVNPAGCEVYSFKAPSSEELDHDFLWRCVCRLPERGRIGVFNRSYYEETLVVRVHRDLLERQRLPRELVTPDVFDRRLGDIRQLEDYLARNGTVIRKFFLHVSKDEQKRRFLDRLDEPDKHWKVAKRDVEERAHWDEYMRAYEDVVRKTAAPHAPWIVVPADRKWYARAVVTAAVVDALASLDLTPPAPAESRRAEIDATRALLDAE